MEVLCLGMDHGPARYWAVLDMSCLKLRSSMATGADDHLKRVLLPRPLFLHSCRLHCFITARKVAVVQHRSTSEIRQTAWIVRRSKLDFHEGSEHAAGESKAIKYDSNWNAHLQSWYLCPCHN